MEKEEKKPIRRRKKGKRKPKLYSANGGECADIHCVKCFVFQTCYNMVKIGNVMQCKKGFKQFSVIFNNMRYRYAANSE